MTKIGFYTVRIVIIILSVAALQGCGKNELSNKNSSAQKTVRLNQANVDCIKGEAVQTKKSAQALAPAVVGLNWRYDGNSKRLLGLLFKFKKSGEVNPLLVENLIFLGDDAADPVLETQCFSTPSDSSEEDWVKCNLVGMVPGQNAYDVPANSDKTSWVQYHVASFKVTGGKSMKESISYIAKYGPADCADSDNGTLKLEGTRIPATFYADRI
jgi:hypothetical protein